MVCKNVPAGVPLGKNNTESQREVLDEQSIRKAEVRLPFSARSKKPSPNVIGDGFVFRVFALSGSTSPGNE